MIDNDNNKEKKRRNFVDSRSEVTLDAFRVDDVIQSINQSVFRLRSSDCIRPSLISLSTSRPKKSHHCAFERKSPWHHGSEQPDFPTSNGSLSPERASVASSAKEGANERTDE